MIFNLSCSEIPILYPQDQRKFLNLTITNAGKNVEKPELSYLIGVNINWYRYRKTIWHFLVKVQDRHTLQPSNSTPRYVPWTLYLSLDLHLHLHIHMHMHIHIQRHVQECFMPHAQKNQPKCTSTLNEHVNFAILHRRENGQSLHTLIWMNLTNNTE